MLRTPELLMAAMLAWVACGCQPARAPATEARSALTVEDMGISGVIQYSPDSPPVEFYSPSVIEESADPVPPRDMARSPAAPAGPQPAAETPTEAAIRVASEGDPARSIRIAIELSDPGFDFQSIRGVDDEERKAGVEAREAQLKPVQDQFVARLTALGATEIDRFWLVNQVAARVPAREVANIAAWPGVLSVSLDGEQFPPWSTAYRGVEARNGMLTAPLIDRGYWEPSDH